MLRVKALQEKMGAIHDQATALSNLAEKEKRDFTAEEQTAFDGYMAEYNRIQEKDLPRAEWLEGEQARLAESRDPGAGGLQQSREPGEAANNAPRHSNIIIPAASRYRHASLKAFKGPHAEQQAYAAGMFYMAVLGDSEQAKKWCAENGVNTMFRGALSTGSNELGGFLIPEEVEQVVIDLRETFGIFRRESRVTPMGGDTKTVPVRKTGLTAYFVGEGQTIGAQDKLWGNVKLIAKKIACLVLYSNEISEDAIISIADDLTYEIAQAFALLEDQCGFIGDATADYGGIKGIVNAVLAGSIVTAAAGHTGFETLTMGDFESVIGRLPEFAGIQPKWYISKVGYYASMDRLMDAAGGNRNEDLANGQTRPMFKGYPVVFTQVLNRTLGADISKPKVILGDLKMGTRFGNRRGMSVMISEHHKFAEDQMAIKGTERFDINVHSTGDADNAGAIVVLKTPGA